MRSIDRAPAASKSYMKNKNQALLQAIENASKNPASNDYREVYHALVASTLLVALDGRPNRGAGSVSDGPTFSLLRLENSSGQAAVLGFTDATTLHRWRQDASYVDVPAQQLFNSLIPIKVDVVIINIGGPIDVVIQRKVFGSLAEGIVPMPGLSQTETVPAGTTLWYGNANTPMAIQLYKAFRMAMQSMDGIVDAFLTERRARPDLPAELVLVVGFKPFIGATEKKQLIDQLGALPSQLMPVGESLVITEETDSFRREMAGKIRPLFP